MSKFQGVIDAAKSREDTAAAKPASLAVSTKRLGKGRPPGKRSDPDFEQVTAYIRKHTHQGVKIALLKEGRGQEFSELVEGLLAKVAQVAYLNTQIFRYLFTVEPSCGFCLRVVGG